MIIDDRKRARVAEAVGIVIIGAVVLVVMLVRYGRLVSWHVR